MITGNCHCMMEKHACINTPSGQVGGGHGCGAYPTGLGVCAVGGGGEVGEGRGRGGYRGEISYYAAGQGGSAALGVELCQCAHLCAGLACTVN